MSTDLNASFNEQYMNISTKLKKRFMRKPNVSEATNEFIGLAIQCEHSEQPAFAGHAYVGAAKGEAAAGNFLGEAEQYLAAARQFMKAEKKLNELRFYSPDRENLEAAIGCFMQALSKYPEKSPLRAAIFMEISEGLIKLNHKFEAVSYYEQALPFIEEKTLKLLCMRKLMNLQIDCGKYDMALDTANTICESVAELPENILTEIQVSRIFLTLLENPTEDSQPDTLKALFKNLMDDNEHDDLLLNMDMKLKLQSIIVTHATTDITSLISVASDLKPFLTTQQRELLETLIKQKRDANLSLV